MIFGAILRLCGRQNKEKPPPPLPRRGGSRRKKPTPAPTGDTVPRQWQPPTKGTTPADRNRNRNRNLKRRRLSRTTHRNAR